MTADELIAHFNRIYGLNKRPQTYEVDANTYAHCCQAVFDHLIASSGTNYINVYLGPNKGINVYLGPNNGLMFKGVELILQK